MLDIPRFLKRCMPFLLFAISFVIYLRTMAPSLYWGDGPELIAAAYTLGIAHPTGYPLYVLIGKLFTLLPFGTVPYRVNLMSAVFASLTVIFVYWIALKITRSPFASVASSLTLALSYTFWKHATIAEVYALDAFFVALLVLLLLRWRESDNDRFFYAFWFFWGLGLTNHVKLVLLAPAVAYFLMFNAKKRIFQPRKLLLMAFFLVLGLSLYIYLPLRALSQPLVNWGNPSSFAALFAHVTGGGYGSYLNVSVAVGHIKSFFCYLLAQFPLNLAFAVAGIALLWKRDREMAVFIGLIGLSNLIFNLFYDIPDIAAYYIPLYMVLSLFIGFGIYKAARYVSKGGFCLVFCAAVLLIAANSLFFLYAPEDHTSPPIFVNGKYAYLTYYNLFPESVDRHDFRAADDYAMFMMDYAKPNAIITSDFDDALFPLVYYQAVEGKRQDLIILYKGLLTRFLWYKEELDKKHPELGLNITKEEGYTGIEFSVPTVLYTIDDNPVFFEQFDESHVGEYAGQRIFVREYPAKEKDQAG